MADDYRIRPTEPADLARLTLLEQAAFSDPWASEMIAESIAGASAVALVAETPDARLVGSVVAKLAADEGEILTIAVDPLCRGAGLGGRLLREALGELGRLGALSVWLEVRPSNAAARGMYRAAGFVTAGVRRGYYRRPLEDALVLVYRPPAPPSTAVP